MSKKLRRMGKAIAAGYGQSQQARSAKTQKKDAGGRPPADSVLGWQPGFLVPPSSKSR